MKQAPAINFFFGVCVACRVQKGEREKKKAGPQRNRIKDDCYYQARARKCSMGRKVPPEISRRHFFSRRNHIDDQASNEHEPPASSFTSRATRDGEDFNDPCDRETDLWRESVQKHDTRAQRIG